MTIPPTTSRARGTLFGQLMGDALGGLVEFRGPESIRREYPDGVRELADGGTWQTMAGQPTDDSEMALALARMLIEDGTYSGSRAFTVYRDWVESDPFDCGMTISAGLYGNPRHESQANGAMMRIAPLGIFGVGYIAEEVATWAQIDAALTHPHPVCIEANILYTIAIAHAIETGPTATELYRSIVLRAEEMRIDESLMQTITEASTSPPADYTTNAGWVLIAFQNALWQLLHAPSFEEGIVSTIMGGGDTDTNAAIAGSLLGSLHGIEQIPDRWINTILACRPTKNNPRTRHPRPEEYWPVDAVELADGLLVG